MRVYVASSWRNTVQPSVVGRLRREGYDVYDFRHPVPGNDGFAWSQIDPVWREWLPYDFRAALCHPLAVEGFGYDMDALRASDACVLVLPCGRSAHLELGYAVGAGKLTVIYQPIPQEPELMYKMCSRIAVTIDEVIEGLRGQYDPKALVNVLK